MNIFFLSFDPKQAAEYHCDKHVVKMILETAQLLYTAHWVLNPEDLPADSYKKTHAQHPCAIWARESRANYLWLAELGFWLCREYTHRYGKIHTTEVRIHWLLQHVPHDIPSGGITEIRLAMPPAYKHRNPVQAYRAYYIHEKVHILKYSRRERPEFLGCVSKLQQIISPETDLHDRRR